MNWLRRIFAPRVKAAQSLATVDSNRGWLTIFDWRPGAWQSDEPQASNEQLLAFSAVYACVTRIAYDIAKLRIKLTALSGGIWTEITDRNTPFLPVLKKPNNYQTTIQFLVQWIVSLLLHGNTYVLKERDQRGIVTSLYVLDPCRVVPLVAGDGAVYYRLADDYLSGVTEQIIVPASEIIHDRLITLWHPLVGVSPIYACAQSATQGKRIQSNSSKFFENMSRPSGVMTAPGTIDDVTALRIKSEFEKGFGGANIGRLFVAGDGLKYEAMTIPANDAQLIEQLKWTVEDVARCFHVPLWKIGAGQMPAYGNSEMANRAYYSETLQTLIESIERLLDEGLKLPDDYGTEFDLDGLLRMDQEARYKANGQAVKDGWMSPDEARAKEGMGPVEGGDTPYLQQQNYSLSALAKRDAGDDPFKTGTPAPEPTPEPEKQFDYTATLKSFDMALAA